MARGSQHSEEEHDLCKTHLFEHYIASTESIQFII